MKKDIKEISENIVEIDGERYVKEDSQGWLDIPEEGISTEIEVHDKNKSWNKLKLSDREKDLLTYDQCVRIANNPKYAKILKMDGSSSHDDFFIQQPFNLNRENGRVAWFGVVDSVDAYLGCWGGPDYSNSNLGVRFARKISEKKKSK